MYQLTKFDDVTLSSFSKITSVNLCKPIHDIIIYFTFIGLFESGKSGKEGKKLQKFEYLENEISYLEKKKTFFIVFEGQKIGKKKKIG